MKAILFLVMFAFSFLCYGQTSEKRTPVDEYVGAVQFALLSCSLSMKLRIQEVESARLNGDAEPALSEKSDFRGCIRNAKAETKKLLGKAIGSLKKKSAQDALKSYHVAAATAIEGIAPGIEERRGAYEQRQQQLEMKVTEAWERFELER